MPIDDSELKPCPFCGKRATKSNELSIEMMAACDNPDCITFGWGMPISLWNTRPIEDQLRAELAAVKEENEAIAAAGLRDARLAVTYYTDLAAARADADRLDNALRLAIDELCGQLHGPRSAVFEATFDARRQHEQLKQGRS